MGLYNFTYQYSYVRSINTIYILSYDYIMLIIYY